MASIEQFLTILLTLRSARGWCIMNKEIVTSEPFEVREGFSDRRN